MGPFQLDIFYDLLPSPLTLSQPCFERETAVLAEAWSGLPPYPRCLPRTGLLPPESCRCKRYSHSQLAPVGLVNLSAVPCPGSKASS